MGRALSQAQICFFQVVTTPCNINGCVTRFVSVAAVAVNNTANNSTNRTTTTISRRTEETNRPPEGNPEGVLDRGAVAVRKRRRRKGGKGAPPPVAKHGLAEALLWTGVEA